MAVRPAAHAREHAATAVDQVRVTYPDLRWIPAPRWHLTLAFYGEVPDDSADGVADVVSRRLRGLPAFSLRLRGAGLFPRRAVWLGVAGDVPTLRRVAETLTVQRKLYRPHLTVARLRGAVDATGPVGGLSDYAGPAWRVEQVHLVRSRLGPAPAYDDIATWTLAGYN